MAFDECSGVIIPDVKMPKNCDECDSYGLSDIYGLKCPCDANKELYSYDKRPDECPLKEIYIKKEDKSMELKDTIELMSSADWKDRFIAEYLQTKIRYEKLHKLIVRREVGKIEFNTPIPLESWNEQAYYMGMYLHELEKQAVIHGIELPKV